MATPIQLASQALRGDIRTEFLETYRLRLGASAKLDMLMDRGIPSDQRTEYFTYVQSLPKPKRWDRGDDMPAEATDMVSWSVTNYTYASAIEWHEEDVEDDKAGAILERARQLATEYVNLDDRIGYQLLTSSTDPDLLPAIPNAPDGAALYSATDGAGADRFGVSGGNIVTGSGVTGQNIRDDFFSAIERMAVFQDTKGEPYHSEDVMDQGFLVIYGSHLEQQVREAFRVNQPVTIVQNVGATENVAAAAGTNVIMDTGMNLQLWGTPRLNGDNDLFIVSLGHEIKPIFRMSRLEVQTDEENRANSDHARRTRKNRMSTFCRYGYGLSLPIQTVKVNNS